MTIDLGPGFCWTCGTPYTTSTALDAHQLETGHELDQPDHPLHQRKGDAVNRKPINTPGGFRLHWRSFAAHHDPMPGHQRVIGRHVYIFRALPDRIDVWRSDMADQRDGYRWTLVHRFHRTVTQYDFATNPQAATCYQTMGVREAEANIRCAVELGDIIREYATTDRAGRPLRVVYHVCTSTDRPDLGGVYEFTR